MYDHFSGKYPEQFAALRALAHGNTALCAALDDYEEISTWLAVQEPAPPRHPDELERAYKLVRELENEILNHLETHDEHVS